MSERFTIELEALPAERFAEIPAEVRLRQVLKIALRRAGLRAVSVRRVRHPAAGSSAATDAADPDSRRTEEATHGQ